MPLDKAKLPPEGGAETTPTEAESAELVQALRAEVVDLRKRLETAEREMNELRQLVLSIDHWEKGGSRRDLGAGLVVTGFAAGFAGVVLHFALRAHVIETDVHLGYIIGLAGLLAFLVGLGLAL